MTWTWEQINQTGTQIRIYAGGKSVDLVDDGLTLEDLEAIAEQMEVE